MADELKTIMAMTPEAREKEIQEARARVQELRFQSRTGRLKGVRELRTVRRRLARLLTVARTTK
jgi:ribosomal protein L29